MSRLADLGLRDARPTRSPGRFLPFASTTGAASSDAPDLLRDAARVGARRALEDRDELLAAVAADEVRLAQAALEQPAERPQHVVAGQVAVELVERPEVVEVEQDDRQGMALALPASRARAAVSVRNASSRKRRLWRPVSGSRIASSATSPWRRALLSASVISPASNPERLELELGERAVVVGPRDGQRADRAAFADERHAEGPAEGVDRRPAPDRAAGSRPAGSARHGRSCPLSIARPAIPLPGWMRLPVAPPPPRSARMMIRTGCRIAHGDRDELGRDDIADGVDDHLVELGRREDRAHLGRERHDPLEDLGPLGEVRPFDGQGKGHRDPVGHDADRGQVGLGRARVGLSTLTTPRNAPWASSGIEISLRMPGSALR